MAAAVEAGHIDHPDAIWAPQGGVYKSGAWHGSFTPMGRASASDTVEFGCRLLIDKSDTSSSEGSIQDPACMTLALPGVKGTGASKAAPGKPGACFQVDGVFDPKQQTIRLLLCFFDGSKLEFLGEPVSGLAIQGRWRTVDKALVKEGTFELLHGRDPAEHELLKQELGVTACSELDDFKNVMRSRSNSQVTSTTVSLHF